MRYSVDARKSQPQPTHRIDTYGIAHINSYGSWKTRWESAGVRESPRESIEVRGSLRESAEVRGSQQKFDRFCQRPRENRRSQQKSKESARLCNEGRRHIRYKNDDIYRAIAQRHIGKMRFQHILWRERGLF